MRAVFYLVSLIVFILLLLPTIKINISLWWLDNLINLQIQWSLLALILIFINFIYIKRLTWISTLLYSSLIGTNLAPLYLPAEKVSVDNEKLSLVIAQLNLHYYNPNIKQLLPLLGSDEFDLLVIQEVSDNERDNIKKLAQYYPYSFGVNPTPAISSGIAILSRWPIIEKIGYKGGHILEVIIQLPKSLAPLQLYALHPSSPRSEELWQYRNQTLTSVATKIAHSPFHNIVVVGDFNSSPWSSTFRNFKAISQLKNSAQGFGYIPSWSLSANPTLSTLTSVYIDHNLISKHLKVINKHAQAINGSDHKLLMTQLLL